MAHGWDTTFRGGTTGSFSKPPRDKLGIEARNRSSSVLQADIIAQEAIDRLHRNMAWVFHLGLRWGRGGFAGFRRQSHCFR